MSILIIAGHGKRKNGTFDPGAVGLMKGEHKYVKEDLFPAMKKYLPKTHNVVFFDEYNVFDRGNIVSLAKEYKAKEVIEVHYDAGSKNATGGHVIIHKNRAPKKIDLALRDAIEKMVGVVYSFKGHKGINGRDNLANLNRTMNAGISYRLIELGYGSSPIDSKIMTEKVDEYAKELVKAIVGEVSEGKESKDKKETKSSSKETKQTTANKSKWVKVTGSWNGSPTLKKGQYGNPVKRLQAMLNEKGYLNKSQIDSYFGDITESAVRKAQKDAKIIVDGLAGKKTYEALSKKEVKKKKFTLPNAVLQRGSRGSQVKQVQTALNHAGYNCGKVDGIYGEKTYDAVKRFQRVYDPKFVDGIYGSRTRERLDRVVNK